MGRFSSFSYITKDGIEGGNPNVFVIKEGNLEDLMKAIDKDLYTRRLSRNMVDTHQNLRLPIDSSRKK
jgi:hypothetical protein